ncbi:excalibur calcium-binding domain-containing protein [Kribbella catacumbae]|uniref:excalibur calcium-binding domain-containing protein n=1 Tax=Kribbella catacumbae TaxID=460086 RepID=UPI0003716EEA|nr:excalibur calcium-binding domain-containing protein [Kribbella catacumbae]
MKRTRAALKAGIGIVATGLLAVGCAAETDTGKASSQSSATTTATATPSATQSKPAGLVSIPPVKKATKAPLKPTIKPTLKATKKPTRKPTVRVTTKPTPKPTKPKPTKTAEDVYYANCSEVRAAGAAPIHRGEPGYSSKLDRDNDGVACEN